MEEFTTKNIPEKLWMSLLDTLFPISCLSCNREGLWLCKQCLSEIQLLDFQLCPDCEEYLTEKGSLCPDCRRSGRCSFDSLIVASSYENPVVKKLVHNLKYRFVAGISDSLASLLISALLKNDLPIPDFIVPVPLHPRRLRWRGFNQSLLLAEKISEDFSPPLRIAVTDILKRKKCNRPQMEIKNYHERLMNIQNNFFLAEDSPDLKNKTVLLVDDIATTGATLKECAKVLKNGGARKVFAIVIARQNFKKD
jgi:ComF family protein